MKFRNPIRTFGAAGGQDETRFSFDDYLSQLYNYLNQPYSFFNQTYRVGNREETPQDYAGFVESILKRNGVVFACLAARQLLFSEARFQFRQFTKAGRPGGMFGTRDLSILEQPWPNGTTGELLSRMEQDASLSGNFYCTRIQGSDGRLRLRRLRPDWVTILLGSQDGSIDADDINAELVGYMYEPKGQMTGSAKTVFLLPEDVCHYSPMPDPTATFRGMSWMTPILREIAADSGATTHKLRFFENAATPNLVVSFDPSVSEEQYKLFKTVMDEKHSGAFNAYKTLYLGGGADVKVVGADFRQMDFKMVQGAGETRIAAAAGVPPVIVGLSEGLQAATYSNYAQARRRFADGTIRPLWRSAAASLAQLVNVPAGAELWYDDRDISFLKEDLKDRAEILASEASTIRTLTDAGYVPDSVIDAITANDLSLLRGHHSGLFSVQLQPAGTPAPTPNTPPALPPAPADAQPAA